MKTKTRIVITVLLVLGCLLGKPIIDLILMPSASMSVGVDQVKDSVNQFYELQALEHAKKIATTVLYLGTMGLLWLTWKSNLMKGKKTMSKRMLILVLMVIPLSGLGCIRPFDTPEYKEVQNNETAFVVPLEGKTSDQLSFASAEYLKTLQVATKRIRIPHRWNKTGRLPNSGQWIPTIKVITVDRTPVTRQWTPSPNTGTSGRDEGIWVESKDSVGFSTGFSCTAHVEEGDSALFLYKYPAGSLASVMDSQIRARIQTIAAEKCGLVDLDLLRGQKDQIIAAIREDVEPFFQRNGITIDTIGMYGGFTYENPAIQAAIDSVFEAQQLEDVGKAKKLAADQEKLAIEVLADAEAQKIQKIAAAEAARIQLVNEAAKEAQQNPLFFKLRQLEVVLKQVEKWDGVYPRWYMGSGLSGASPELTMMVDTNSIESSP